MNKRHLVDLGYRIAVITYGKRYKHGFESKHTNRASYLDRKERTEDESAELNELLSMKIETTFSLSDITLFKAEFYENEALYNVKIDGQEWLKIQSEIDVLSAKKENLSMSLSEYLNIHELPF